MTDLLEAIADEFTPPEKEVDISFAAEQGLREPQFVLAPELRHALANLIDNAIQFAKRQVTIEVTRHHAGLRILIEDDGPGFAPDILDWLGEPYVSTRGGRGGMGLGVFIANTLLTPNRRTLAFRQRGARGSRFDNLAGRRVIAARKGECR